MEYELGVRIDRIEEKLNWIITALDDNKVRPKPQGGKENGSKNSKEQNISKETGNDGKEERS